MDSLNTDIDSLIKIKQLTEEVVTLKSKLAKAHSDIIQEIANHRRTAHKVREVQAINRKLTKQLEKQ